MADEAGERQQGGERDGAGDPSTTGDVSRVAWYQVIPATASPQWITPSGAFAVGFASVTVPAGYVGYDIDQLAE